MGKNERILFVEDEVSVWGLYKEMLSDLGYRVMPFTSSLDAWEAFQNWPNEFDLAIVDQSMPRMSGLELASKLLDVRPSLPVLLCASHDSSTSLDEIRKTGIRDRLVKPFSSHELAAALRRMLSA
jgi:CheY-like chemotaxis protein